MEFEVFLDGRYNKSFQLDYILVIAVFHFTVEKNLGTKLLSKLCSFYEARLQILI